MPEKAVFPIPDLSLIPKHVAIIMDGNGRWAKARLLPRAAGHLKGVDAVRTIVKACVNRKVEFLTLFAFSSENWRRPIEEVNFLMELFITSLKREVVHLHSNNIRLKVIGNLGDLNEKLQETILRAEQKTAENTSLTLTVCANYGGQWDIMQAMEKMRKANPDQTSFTPDQLKPYLSMAYAPDPDLFIRTGGEKRISNFLLWQLAYTELYFTDTFWPDFDEKALDLAIASFQTRERRFGRTSEQLTV